jgi:hypothetical protein
MERFEQKPELFSFGKHFSEAGKIQVVKGLDREKTYPDGVQIRTANNWLSEIRLVYNDFSIILPVLYKLSTSL